MKYSAVKYSASAWCILPASEVLFNKRKVELQEIVQQWPEGTVVVCKKPNGSLHFIAGSNGSYGDPGTLHDCCHDQTLARLGSWMIVNEIEYRTAEDGVEWKPRIPFDDQLNLKTKAPVAVFK